MSNAQDRWIRFARAYTDVARAVLGTILVLAVANLLLYAWPSLRASRSVDTPLDVFGLDRLLPAYPGWDRADLAELHRQSRVTFVYEPIVQFKIAPMSGTYVNAVPQGYRLNQRQGPWPPRDDAWNVFVFGGSTTFGWLLRDRDTIVSQLQDRAGTPVCGRPVVVYNFGQPSYISTQEGLLFLNLLRAGVVPDMAIFIDGLNEFFFRGEMSFSNRLQSLMEGADLTQRLGPVTEWPLYQLARRLRARLFYAPPVMDSASEQQLFQRIVDQWLQNKRFIDRIGRQHGVATTFVWQPVPTYKYDLRAHFLYAGQDLAGATVPYADVGRGYRVMETKRQTLEAEQNFLWLADMQEAVTENLYVDRVHYTAAFSGAIAERILTFVTSRHPAPCAN